MNLRRNLENHVKFAFVKCWCFIPKETENKILEASLLFSSFILFINISNNRMESSTPKETKVTQLLSQIINQTEKCKVKQAPLHRDFTKENIKRLREIQTNKRLSERNQKPLKADWSLDQYSDAPIKSPSSAVYRSSPRSITSSATDQSRSYTRVKSPKTEQIQTPVLHRQRSFNYLLSKKGEMHKETLPETTKPMKKCSSVPDLLVNEKSKAAQIISGADQKTKGRAVQIQTKSDTKSNVTPTKTYQYHPLGKIPKYLIQRKQEQEQEKLRQQKEALCASIPPGYTLISEEKRQQTLELLKTNHKELLNCLASFPVHVCTLRSKRERQAIEDKLDKVEEGIAAFSKPKVLIKDDS